MLWQGVLLGQTVCIFNTAAGIFSSLLAECGVRAPLFQLLWSYVGLFLVFGALLAHSTATGRTALGWRRAAMVSVASIPDSQGNFLMNLSYSYTSLASVAVLMQSIFLMVAVMSYVFNGKRYSKTQYVGLTGCTVGMCLLVTADLHAADWKFDGTVSGDLMTLSGAFLYSACVLDSAIVFQENMLQRGVQEYEYLACLGFWGALTMAAESSAIEFREVQKIRAWTHRLYIIGFAVSNVSFYAAMPFFIKRFGATLFNLSLIPTIVYTLLFSLIAYHTAINSLYLCGYSVVLGSLFLFSFERPPLETADVSDSDPLRTVPNGGIH